MIAVTGMHRSGTSCFAGLLSRCGCSLGSAYPLLNENRPDNEKGHYENLGVVAINETILRCAGGSWLTPPSPERIAATSERFFGHIKQFSRIFDGNIFKDPRMCLTIASWEKQCSQKLEFVILCLRHPASVALSLKRRDNIEIGTGLSLWLRYNRSLLEGISKTPLIIADYDRLKNNFSSEITQLLLNLGIRMPENKISRQTKNFYSEKLNHARIEEIQSIHLPDDIALFYRELRSLGSEAEKETEARKPCGSVLRKFLNWWGRNR